MKLTKLTAEEAAPFFCDLPAFGEPVSVQGGTLQKAGNVLLVQSRRYKLFGAKRDYLKITAGGGFIKWARGETKFSAGDCFLAEDLSEYEVNGAEQFLAVRR